MAKLGFGELELTILTIIQKLGRATVRDVYEKLGRDGSYTTIMTVMSRMAEKGELLRTKEGKQYVYWKGSTHTSSTKTVLRRILDKIFGGNSTALVSYLLETDNKISDKELEELEKLIQKRKGEKEMDKATFFILNIFLNSFLAFITVVILIEAIIFLFRIRQGRIAANLRMIPLLKLPLDLCLYDFSRWSYAHGINPLDSEVGTRTLSFYIGWIHFLPDYFFNITYSGIQLSVAGDKTFTLADLIGYTIDPLLLKILVLLFLSLTAAMVMKRVFLYYHTFKMIDYLASRSHPISRNIKNPLLSERIKKYGVRLLTCATLEGSPFVAGLISSIIYFPPSLSKNLSEKEFEAVIAHEMEHVRYKDSWVRLILNFIGALFWWIPSKWLCRRIEEGQEVGCDLKCKNYGVDGGELASALFKSAKYSKNTSHLLFAHHFTKHKILKRVNFLLSSSHIRFKTIRFTLGCLAMGIGYFVIFLGRFWTF